MSARGTVEVNADTSAKQKLDSIISRAVSAGKSVSLWRLPDAHERYLVIANAVKQVDASYTLEDSPPGFLVAPFDPAGIRHFLPADELYVVREQKLEQVTGSPDPDLNRVQGRISFHRRESSERSGHSKN